ncbi:MAG: LEA type 2 family protein [Spirochaetaceae bacterium]|jgi:LEA14-like dessication related protein|nr:LEA type 2 family protein [Spirochaetaceae bacterium]
MKAGRLYFPDPVDDTYRDMITVKSIIPLILLLMNVCLSCKTVKPEHPPSLPAASLGSLPNPAASLIFERVEAETVEHITLYFTLEVENPRTASAVLDIQDWRIVINQQDSNGGAVLALDSERSRIGAGASAHVPVRLDLDMNRVFPSGEESASDYLTELQMHLKFVFDTGDTAVTHIDTIAAFPRIREPEFSIASIAVGKGERISTTTRFRLKLQIDNPNIFPLELSSLSYSFYGDGDFWADGEQTGLLHIPANGSAETYVYFIINFIDISRNLQKQLVALKQISYRLTGESRILTNIVYLPEFRMDFDLSGDSNME